MITKTEAMVKLTEKENAEYALWEAKIDEALRTHSERTTIDVRELSMRVRDRLMTDYRKAQWTVDYVSDQRDGGFLSFT